MTDKPRKFEGEDRRTRDLAPETHNAEQDESGAQAQDLANDALGRSSDDFGLEDSKKVPSGKEGDDVQDLLDHMKQMVSSGRIDNSAYRGEPNLDDDEDKYGPGSNEDDRSSDGT